MTTCPALVLLAIAMTSHMIVREGSQADGRDNKYRNGATEYLTGILWVLLNASRGADLDTDKEQQSRRRVRRGGVRLTGTLGVHPDNMLDS